MNLRGLLYKYMYHDTAQIYRSVKVTRGYVSTFEWQAAGAPFACKLSQYGHQLSAHRDDRAQLLTDDLRLTCDPEIEILPNDVLIIQHQGQEWELVAGEAFRYPTHIEISCRRRKEAGQI